MRGIFTLAVALVLPSLLTAQAYKVATDLGRAVDDRLFVEVSVPPVSLDTATYIFPVTIPGTYEEHNWWRFVSDFKAFDDAGSPLPVERSVDSQFVIRQAKRLAKVSYWIDDSFDDPSDLYAVFQPAGTSFEPNGIFVFNHAGLTGYIEGMQSVPFEVTVRRPETLYCSTALRVKERTAEHVVYTAESYDDLIDGPVMFCKPDTASFQVNGTRVLVALAHTKDTSVASNYANDLKKVTKAIEDFLPSLPVDRYAFLLYLWDGDTTNVKRGRFAQGALEHNYSSFYFWRYTSRPFGLKDVAAHEFLHILVPLNVHSREIDEFNFRKPEWSAHLWLYEGVTEYFSEQALLRANLNNESTYISHLKQFVRSMNYLPDTFSLVEFSRNVVTEENQALYPFIYQYGPLNALIMDILIREAKGVEGGLLELVYQLKDRYGPSRPFNDDDLFREIGELTSPAVEEYCRLHIQGRGRLPLGQHLPKIGLQYKDSVLVEAWSYGVDVTSHDAESSTLIIAPKDVNTLDIREGDRLLEVNGTTVSMENARVVQLLWNPKGADEITITVERDGQKLELTGRAVKTTTARHHVIEEDPNATSEQLAFRRLVFYGAPH